MTIEDDRPKITEARNSAGPFEKVGIWASYRLLQYLDSLGQTPKRQPLTTERVSERIRFNLADLTRETKRFTNRNQGYIVTAGVLLITAAMFLDGERDRNNKRALMQRTPVRSTLVLPVVGVGSEQTNPYLLIQTLNGKGSHATFAYGGIDNETKGLIFQVDPAGLNSLIETNGLTPPPGKIITTIITEGENPTPDTGLNVVSQYEKEQGKFMSEMLSGPLSFSSIKKALPESKLDLHTPLADIQFTIEWLSEFKRQREFMDTGVAPRESKLTSTQIASIGKLPILPFRILAYPD